MKTPPFLLSLCLLAWLLSGRLIAADTVRERIYLQTDKQTYLSGEMLWLKAFLTDERGKPASMSKTGYVELHNGSASVIQLKMELSGGTGQGWMELPATLPTGYYDLVAYTRYMRNEGERVFFHKTIAIVNPFRTEQSVGIDTTLQASPVASAPTLTVSTDSSTYSTRSPGEIRLQGLPAGVHSLSLSVAGKDIAPDVEPADIVRWQAQLAQLPQPPLRAEFLPEYEGHIVNGRLVNVRTGSPAQERVVSYLAFPGGQVRLFGGQAGAEGQVSFFTRRIAGMREAALLTLPDAAGETYRAELLSPFAPLTARPLPPFRINPSWADELLQRSVALQAFYIYTPDWISQETGESPAAFTWTPDKTYLLDEYTRFLTMEEVISEFVLRLSIRRERGKRYLSVLREDRIGQALPGSSTNSLVLLDGIPVWEHDLICSYNPLQVRRIDIYRGTYFFGGQYFDGIAFFSTYAHRYPGLPTGEATRVLAYEGTQPLRLFRYPSYRHEAERKSPVPDFRHTLLWLPEVDAGGQASVTLPFSTSDYTGEFRVSVEGLTAEGEAIRGVAVFQVK